VNRRDVRASADEPVPESAGKPELEPVRKPEPESAEKPEPEPVRKPEPESAEKPEPESAEKPESECARLTVARLGAASAVGLARRGERTNAGGFIQHIDPEQSA